MSPWKEYSTLSGPAVHKVSEEAGFCGNVFCVIFFLYLASLKHRAEKEALLG